VRQRWCPRNLRLATDTDRCRATGRPSRTAATGSSSPRLRCTSSAWRNGRRTGNPSLKGVQDSTPVADNPRLPNRSCRARCSRSPMSAFRHRFRSTKIVVQAGLGAFRLMRSAREVTFERLGIRGDRRGRARSPRQNGTCVQEQPQARYLTRPPLTWGGHLDLPDDCNGSVMAIAPEGASRARSGRRRQSALR
jgi:hypothetical protein